MQTVQRSLGHSTCRPYLYNELSMHNESRRPRPTRPSNHNELTMATFIGLYKNELTTQGTVSKTACCIKLQPRGLIHKARSQSSYATGATARSRAANSSPLMGSSLPRSHDGTDVLAPTYGVETWAGACGAAMGLHGQLAKAPME